ncbi:hypothetical protein RhiirA5_438455 [Rhizophagus irregularis]|uniref:Uncharacterized protein n=1 Tax=Rhizophagus irregularis TaxID=588596 RepID=A0A2N0NJ33_9GLOM|nr:hypothetical protein RhiirA5_438455 [Rhizophagus irregularis]
MEYFDRNASEHFRSRIITEYFDRNVSKYLRSRIITEYFDRNISEHLRSRIISEYFDHNASEYLRSRIITEYFDRNVLKHLRSRIITEYFDRNVSEHLRSCIILEYFDHNASEHLRYHIITEYFDRNALKHLRSRIISEYFDRNASEHLRSRIITEYFDPNFSRSLPNPILFLSQALGLINLFAHQRQYHITNLFLMANSSSFFIQSLFIYRLCLIQYNFLISISPLLIKDWSIWSSLLLFKKDYIACTIALLTSTPFRLLHTQLSKLPNLSLLDGRVPLFECMTPKAFKAYFPILRKRQLFYLSQLVTPQGSHLISWKAYYDNLVGRRGPGRIPFWYKDIQQVTTVPDSNNRLLDRFIVTYMNDSSSYDLAPCLSSPPTTKNWIVILDDYGSPIFGKQLLVQASRGTCSIVHWISPDCESSPGDLIRLAPCLGCAAHIPLPPSKKRNADLTICTSTVSLQHSFILLTTNERIRRNTSEVTSSFTWTDIEDGVRLYYSRLDFNFDSPPADTDVAPFTIESSAAAVFANSPRS